MGAPRSPSALGPAGSSRLDWAKAQRRYGAGASLTDMPGRPVEITGVDDHHVHICSLMWRDSPAHALPTAECPRSFAEAYRRHVADARGSAVAFSLCDPGHLE